MTLPHTATIQLLFVVVVLLSAGCSAERLPLRPAPSQSSAIPPGSAATMSGETESIVIVTVADGQDAGAIAADYEATLLGNSWRVAALKPRNGQTADELTFAISGDSRIESAETNVLVETAETRQASFAFDDGHGNPETCVYQPANVALGIDVAHGLSRGSGVRIALLDTGADPSHAMLAGRVLGGWDFVQGDADFQETGDGLDNDSDGRVDEAIGHGTHVAGILTAVAPEAQLLIARVLDGEGQGDMLTVARAIRWAAANGARVINLSLGGLTKSDAVKLALEEAMVGGVVNVAAAGNWGSIEPEEFPASCRFAIAVAALDVSDVLAPFSSYGRHIGLCAPGVAIRSAYRDGGYASWSGTSMAAPYVAGAAALLLARHLDWDQKQVLDRLWLTARDLDLLNPALVGYLGAGGVHLGAALMAELASEDPVGEPDPDQ